MPAPNFSPTAPFFLTLSDVVLEGTQHRRLDGISLQLGVEKTAILGLSGAGKTSLLNVLAGFEVPTSGQIVLSPPSTESRLFRYWVPQNGGLWPHVELIGHLRSVAGGAADSEIHKKSDEILDAFDLRHRANAFPDELSQGERSRLALARALMANPRVLLADEPLAHVDIVRKPDFWKVVDEWVSRAGCSFVFSSHEPEVVLRHAERVIVLETGSVIFDGPVSVLYDNPPEKRVAEFLGPVNWLGDPLRKLLGGFSDRDCGIRPERIALSEDPSGKFEVVRSFRTGFFQETSLTTARGDMEFSLIHRGHSPLAAKTRVSVTIDRISTTRL
ncbi:MAG: ABC transporter ATP-binding protein [Planctomycetaceae bacterium]